MKMAKKVLSVVLAIAMALSCFAVAASAYGPKDADYQAKIWLTASTGDKGKGKTAYWTANTTLTITDNEECVTGEIEAEPGQAVWIRVYQSANYYPLTWQTQLFYSANLLDAVDQNKVDRPSYTFVYNTNNLKKIRTFNDDGNTWLAELGGSTYSTVFYTPWGYLSADNKANIADWWPTADGDTTTSLLDTSKYKFAYFGYGISNEMAGCYDTILDDIDPDDAWIIKMPFFVPADAKPGDTFTVTIPEGTFRRPAKPYGQTFLTQLGAATEEQIEEGEGPSYIDPDNPDMTEQPIDMTGNINFDFSDATITIKVPGGSSLDYTALEKAIGDFEKLTEADWTADSWATAKTAYNNAKTAKTDATTQEAVTAAATALDNAIKALVAAGPTLDFTELEAAIGKTPDDLSAYTTSSADAVVDAWSDAMFARSADNQDDIDAATIALNEAIDALKLKVDTTELAAALAAAAAVEDIDDWFELDVDDLNDAIAAGEALMTNADDTSVDAQDTFDDAADAINDILANHSYSVANYTEVWNLMDYAAGLTETDYTAASWEALETALGTVVPGLLKSKQGQVDEMAAAIQNAIDGLKEIADTSRLERAVEDALAANEDDYAEDVWTQIQNYVADADNYIGKGLATDDFQGDIDALTDDLNAALANTLGAADYADVNIAVNKMPDDFSLYTDESTQAVIDAYNAIDWTLKEDKQDLVNKMAADLEDAIDKLAYKPANFGALAAALTKAQAVDPELVSEDSYLALDLAMTAAATLMGGEVDIRDQADIDDAAAALNDAYDALVWLGADYTALDAAIARFDDLDEDLYTAASLLAAKTAYDAAKAVARNLGKADQDTIDTAANALNAAIEGLEYLPGDYSRIDALQATVDAIGAANEWRYDDSLTQLKAILANLDKNLTKADQATIDAAADEGEAIELKYSAYDYTDYNTAINEFRALNPDDYTTESYQAALAAINGINWNLTNSVDDYKAGGKYLSTLKKALKVGTGGLVEVGPADYTAVDAAIAVANGKNEDDYTPESWAALDAAIKAVVRGVNANYQDEVDKMAADINAAIAALVEKAAPVNYDLLAAKYDAVKDTELENAVVGKDAFENALAAAKDILDNRTADQATVDAALETLTEAYEALKFGADYSVLEDLIASAGKLNKDDWTAESWANLEDALADANAVPAGLTTDDQATIDDAADVLSLALESLQKYVAPAAPADYTALNAAINAAALKDQAIYTDDSWADFALALANAKAVDKNLTEDDQKTIDDAAEALNTAMNALVVKPAVVGGQVTDVTWTPSKDNVNDFTITVQGRASFVQFVEFDYDNGTRSRSRYSDGVTIVSYDKDGNVVDDRSKDVAYEEWTLTDVNLTGPDMGVRAKFGNKWEAMEDCYTFTYNVLPADVALVSAELSKTSGKKTGAVPATVVTGGDVEYLQVVMEDGSTVTVKASKATKLENGNLQFTINCWANHTGECLFTLRTLAKNTWTEIGTLTYTVNKASSQEIKLPE